jgi:hypothetical protein
MAISPFLTAADTIVLENLLHDVDIGGNPSSETLNDVDQAALDRVIGLSDETSNDFESTVFTGWDIKDLHLPSIINHAIVQSYPPLPIHLRSKRSIPLLPLHLRTCHLPLDHDWVVLWSVYHNVA